MKKITLFLFSLLLISEIFAQEINQPQDVTKKVIVTTASEFHVTQSINMLYNKEQIDNMDFDAAKEKAEIDREERERSNRKAQTFKYSVADGPQYGNDPASIQTTMGTRQSLGVIKKWNGLSGSSQPLDPSGAVGMTQFVESINATPFAAYDKSGTGATVYSGSVGTITGTGSDGDPVVIYDKFADRWVICQMNGASGIGIAVSKTNNPAGAWSAYKFTFAAGGNDYIKFSVWSDGYYMTGNTSGNILVFERAAMIAGTAGARSIGASFTIPTNAGEGFWLPLPGDADGVLPPAGLRCPLFAYTDNAWGSPEIDGVKVWSVGVTWGTTPTANVTLDATLPTAAFDASYQSSWNDVTQPGSQKLDGIGGICMFKSQWSSFVGTNRVVLNWGVLIAGGQRSIKWVELRQDQTTKVWSLYQEGTYTPDASNRWLGSIAMDCSGNIGLCYSKTSASIPMCLAYTGRLATDPLGTMTLAETIAFPGTGSISGSNRIGDYSQTSIDPADGNTFWHVGTYCNAGRKTGIFSFQIAPCSSVGIDEPKKNIVEFSVFQIGTTVNVKCSQLSSNDPLMVQLYDIAGKKISEKEINPTTNSFEAAMDVSGLAAGLYIVRIGNSNFQKVKKIEIN